MKKIPIIASPQKKKIQKQFNKYKREKVKILFLIDVLREWGGTEKHLNYLLQGLDKHIYKCQVIAFDSNEKILKEIKKSGVAIYSIPVGRYYSLHAAKQAVKIKKIIKDQKIDILQTFHYKSDNYGVAIGKLGGVKYIISSRRDIGDIKRPWHRVIQSISNQFIDLFITVCDAVRNRLIIDEKVPVIRTQTIYNGIDSTQFPAYNQKQINKIKIRLNLPIESFVVGMVANFRPEKNHDTLLKAAGIAKNTIENLAVLLVGDGPTANQCKKYCRDNNMSKWVKFTGAVDDVRDYIGSMDIACLVPGSNEGFSNAILEKMAMGKPLIVTDVGGNAEAVEHGRNGLVIPPYRHDLLYEAINDLYIHTDKRYRMGKEGRKIVTENFRLQKMIDEHEMVYQNLFSR